MNTRHKGRAPGIVYVGVPMPETLRAQVHDIAAKTASETGEPVQIAAMCRVLIREAIRARTKKRPRKA